MIHIFYRATNYPENGNKCRPNYFSLEKCFKNLLDTLDSNKTKLTIVFDGKIENSFIPKYQNNYKFNVYQIDAKNDFVSNTMTFEYIKNQEIKNDDIIYLLEHDYLHRKGWVEAIEHIYSQNINFDMNNTYISLYDHGDKYNRNFPNRNDEWGMYGNLKSQIYLSLYGYLRTVPNTCGSFLLKKELFDKDFDVHTSGEADNTRFHILSKDPYNRKVLSFMPGFSTHLHTHYMSPFIDWEKINNTIEI